MRFSSVVMHRARSLFRRSRVDSDLQREIELHFEQLVKEAIASGMSESEARMAAQHQFGPVEKTKEECRDMRRVNLIENFLRDVRYALRTLAGNPGFAAMAIITLGLGIAANTTIFSAVSAILLRKPSVKDPDRLCAVSSKDLVRGYDLVRVSAPDFESWEKQNDVFEEMAAVESGRSFTLTGKSAPEAAIGDRVTTDYFNVIGMMPVLGRAFLAGEDQAGNDHVVVLSDALWRERFGSDPNAIAKGSRNQRRAIQNCRCDAAARRHLYIYTASMDAAGFQPRGLDPFRARQSLHRSYFGALKTGRNR